MERFAFSLWVMAVDRLLGSYILRVTVRENHWHLVLYNPNTGDFEQFASFKELCRRLEQHEKETELVLRAALTPVAQEEKEVKSKATAKHKT